MVHSTHSAYPRFGNRRLITLTLTLALALTLTLTPTLTLTLTLALALALTVSQGPDSYRDLPRLLGLVMGRVDVVAGEDPLGDSASASGSLRAMNVQLSQDETYGDIIPVSGSDKRHPHPHHHSYS